MAEQEETNNNTTNEVKLENREDLFDFFTKQEVQVIEFEAADTLESMSKTQSFFTKTSYLKAVRDKLPDELIHKPKFTEALNLVCKYLHIAEVDGSTSKDYSVITSKFLLHAEKEMLALAAYETDEHVLDTSIVQNAIDGKKGISEEQTVAVWECCGIRKRVSVVEGTAGAGKSFTMAAVKESYERSGYKATGAALSWAAAANLEASTGLKGCKAIEGLLREIEQCNKRGMPYFTQPTVLIIDEAGLAGTLHMYKLLKATHEASVPVKIVLTGDSLQLNPVDAGNALEAIVDYCGSARIDTIRRQKQESHRKAVKMFCYGDAGKALPIFMHQEALHWMENKEELLNKVVEDFLSFKVAFPNEKALILALSNKDVITLNEMVRKAYKKLGFVEKDEITLQVTDGRMSWEAAFSVGDMVSFRKNDKNMQIYEDETKQKVKSVGLFNRMFGVIKKIKKAERGYDFDIELHGESGGYFTVNTEKFFHAQKHAVPINHNFAMTIYASQGQTVNKVFLIDSTQIQRRLAYVGMSRHTHSIQIYFDKEDLKERVKKITKAECPHLNLHELIHAVAFVWAKEAKNQTAIMMLKDKKEFFKNKKLEEEHAQIDMTLEEEFVDFIEEYNPKYPTIDLQKLLDENFTLPQNKKETPIEVTYTPITTKNEKKKTDDHLEIRTIEAKTEKKGFFDSLFGFIKSDEPTNKKQTTIEVVQQETPKEIKKETTENKKNDNINSLIPFKDEPNYTSNVSNGIIIFKDQKIIPSEEFMKETKKKYWNTGVSNQPRFLAQFNGKTFARYDEFGTCIVGNGLPPMHINADANEKTPVYITPSAREWLVTLEYFQKKFADKPEEIPHMVWAAKDVNWKLVAKSFKNKEVIVMRSKQDETQIEWAVQTQELLEQNGIHSTIKPEIKNKINKKP